MNRFNNVILGQKAFIINTNKEILILKRQNSEVYNDLWDVPGGKLEEGDTLLEAISREIREETGLKLQRIISVLSSSKFQGQASDKPIIFRNIYLVKAEGDVVISNEHQEYKWVDVSKIADYTFGNDQDLQMVLKRLPAIVTDIDLNMEHSIIL
jgi:8-oxo-dGTP diphosphatase